MALYVGLDATKPVLGVSDQGRLKPVFSATETSNNNANLLVASLNIILNNKRIKMRLSVCADRFSRFETHFI